MKFINDNKLNRIKLNKNNFYVLVDFDRTLTKGNSVSGWRILYYSNLVGDDFRHKYDIIHKKTSLDEFESKENKINAFENRFKEYMELLKQNSLDNEIIRKSVENCDVQLRDGAKEFFKKMYDNEVPVIIISCSLGNVIMEYLKYNNCHYDNVHIYSNYFMSNGNHIYNITPYNKNEIIFEAKVKDRIVNRKYILLLGDIIEDKNMVLKEKLDDTITIGFLDKNIKENLELYKNNFDIVLTDNSSFSELDEFINI